ncbi:DegT/DnrJ/EryC1/StrS family aminotransferase [Marispirochaeta aestuarii]|uniref:DegT/DnrJ/EryC1/StrS family aminotransferase n=1 Tax=Marispirochaeta aestuarii TaxID=1963862 RepID=UPI0029C91036|nr:DegT/DnrJ/EryC1/StrS family aminotransferase [Marispirochaeta aestuarii]
MIKPFEKPLFVTQPYLPPLSDFTSGLREIWENKWLTNNGPVLDRYTKKLSNYFENNNICLFNNGTLALQIALQGMKISGEVITTPFTFVATTHVLFWNKIRPVFVDIEPDYYTLDPEKVEAAITPWTTAILAVHVYGHPCRLDELSDIAKRHNLRLLYDAAHAFGVKVKGKPISEYGDLSMFSFHATKIYHSIEGGMLIFKENGFKDVFDYLKNFGFKNELEVVMPGTNAKMNEFQALMGELMLDHMPKILSLRKKVYEAYRKYLKNIPGIKIPISQPEYVDFNYGYMPIEIDECSFGLTRDRLYEKLKGYNVYARRYFYPLINEFACYRSMPIKDSLSVARRIAKRILTLPIFPDLSEEQVRKISNIINEIRIEENIDGK